MLIRTGHSPDYSEERRREIFETTKQLEGKESWTSIGKRFNMSYQTFFGVRKSNWWKELEEEYATKLAQS